MIRYREEQLAKSRRALGEEAFNKTSEEGRSMDVEDAIYCALSSGCGHKAMTLLTLKTTHKEN